MAADLPFPLSIIIAFQDVAWLIAHLNPTYLVEAYEVPDPTFGHNDFLFGIDAYLLVYGPVLQHLASRGSIV